MELIWYLDRASGMVAYPALYLAVLTGIFYNAREFGTLYDAAQRVHVEISVFAIIVTLAHGVLGAVDSWLVVTGQVPQPAYSTEYLLAGGLVGVGSLLVLSVSVVGFLDAKRFDRPWGPKVVHAFAYAGFAFATVHAAALGTDVMGIIRPAIAATTAFLVYVLLLRLLAQQGRLPGAGVDQ